MNYTSFLFLIYLVCVMIICNIIKEHNLFLSLYEWLIERIKSKKVLIFLISCLSGILPIPGRVVISSGLLDTLVDKEKSLTRSKYGIIDFLSTHHYYWWSPLEKTVIIPMAALGLSYIQFIRYTWVPLLICLLFTFYYIFISLNEKDVHINKPEHKYRRSMVFTTLPILLSIILMCFNIQPYWIFPFTTIYYIIYCKEYDVRKLLKFVNWGLVLLTSIVILLSELIALKSDFLLMYLKSLTQILNIHSLIGFTVISVIAFTITFTLGSSAKYAGVVALLTSLFGIRFLTYFLCLEFFAYILSPMHKCVLISSKYFNTPLVEYYKVLSIWGIVLLLYGLATIILK